MDSDTYLNNDDIYSPDRLNEEKNELLVNDHDFDGFISNESNGTSEVKSIYQELAEKDEALLLAAQFGKNLIDEKEELERQIENVKREHQNQLENYEQESYQLKRMIESMKNEYESKIYDLNDDLNILNKKLKQSEIDFITNSSKYDLHTEEMELIQELKEQNRILMNQLNSNDQEIRTLNERNIMLKNKVDEKEKIIEENSKLLGSYQKEISKLLKAQQDIEYALMQTCNERDKQVKLIEELSNKYILLENDKNELEHLIYQHESEIYNLRQINKSILLKLEKFEYPNVNGSVMSNIKSCDKRRSLSYLDSNAIKKNISSKDLTSQSILESTAYEPNLFPNLNTANNKNIANSNLKTNADEIRSQTTTNLINSNNFNSKENSSSIFNYLTASSNSNNNKNNVSINSYKSYNFSGSNLDDDDEDNDYDVEDNNNYIDFVRHNEIEDEDDLINDELFVESIESNHRPIFVNWQQESTNDNLVEVEDDDEEREIFNDKNFEQNNETDEIKSGEPLIQKQNHDSETASPFEDTPISIDSAKSSPCFKSKFNNNEQKENKAFV